MIKNIKKLLIKYREIIFYLLFGVLTTVINYIVYFAFLYGLNIHYIASNIIAWVVAVTFAYITNRAFVFNSHSRGKKIVDEFIKFIGARIVSGVMETVILFIGIDLLNASGIFVKIFASILVVIANYFFSKLIIFTK